MRRPIPCAASANTVEWPAIRFEKGTAETPLLRGRRTAVIAGSGQSKLPAIQLGGGNRSARARLP